MKIFWASDHAGFNHKNELINFWKVQFPSDQLIDIGPFSTESTDYSEWAILLCKRLLEDISSSQRGVLICGSGIGMSMAANRFSKIRAALCRSEEDARLSREHNDANVICLGARATPLDQAKKILSIWRASDYAGGRHQQRIERFDHLGSC
ncbi:MAG: ribose 5-phosphate isomerase B [Oligoflexia bacterium]|nr:ribose 5-phosphate isomerase B [Oligoflexia bacterium]